MNNPIIKSIIDAYAKMTDEQLIQELKKHRDKIDLTFIERIRPFLNAEQTARINAVVKGLADGQ